MFDGNALGPTSQGGHRDLVVHSKKGVARLIGRLPGGCRHHLECAAALLVNIEQALSTPLDERRALHDALFQVLMANDGKSWGERSLVDPDGRSNYRTGLGGLIRTDLIGTLIFQLAVF